MLNRHGLADVPNATWHLLACAGFTNAIKAFTPLMHAVVRSFIDQDPAARA